MASHCLLFSDRTSAASLAATHSHARHQVFSQIIIIINYCLEQIPKYRGFRNTLDSVTKKITNIASLPSAFILSQSVGDRSAVTEPSCFPGFGGWEHEAEGPTRLTGNVPCRAVYPAALFKPSDTGSSSPQTLPRLAGLQNPFWSIYTSFTSAFLCFS